MKIKAITVILILIFSSGAFCQDEIVGTWLANEGKTKIEIFNTDTGKYLGKIVWLKTPTDRNGKPHTDQMNPDESLRDQPIMGLTMLENVTYKNGKWYGTIYSPKRGKTLDAELTLAEYDELDLKVSYRGFSRKRTWFRTEVVK